MSITIRDIMNWMEAKLPNKIDTVDRLLSGNEEEHVKKIAVAFTSSVEVLKKSAALGANLLICHESPYYDHHNTNIHTSNLVVREKMKLADELDISIYRNHDSLHRQFPDMITAGLVHELGWSEYVEGMDEISTTIQQSESSLEETMIHIKKNLNIHSVRYIGNLRNRIRKISVLAGFRGSATNVIPLLEESDLVIYGEGPEWETPEFVKDALTLGYNKNVIILGHMESEEPGMRCLVKHLRETFPEVQAEFIASKPFIHQY